LIEDLYVSQDQVQWVVLPYALSDQTLPAAAASMCAADQERFFEFHKLMFQMQGQPQALTAAGSQQAAEELGLDLDVFNRCLADAKYIETVRQNIAAAGAMGVAATPTFFINDQILEGNRPLTTFQGLISAIVGGANES
jgi:protein-disulfide isomerase